MSLRESKSTIDVAPAQQQPLKQAASEPQLRTNGSADNFIRPNMTPADYKRPDPAQPKTVPRGTPPLDIKCGPLLRYWGMRDTKPDIWRGSIMIVTKDDSSDYSSVPEVALSVNGGVSHASAKRVFAEYGVTFWRWDVSFDLAAEEQKVAYYINKDEENTNAFYIPAKSQTMNVMFYSCNGFSLGVDPSQFQGELWNDVIKQHDADNHFHVMLGGGDQLYCDKVKVATDTLWNWSHEKNPIKKRSSKLGADEKAELDQFYLWHYMAWFGQGYFRGPHGKTVQAGFPRAMAQIPSINIFDDHDIIDGFGTYTDGIMRSGHMSGTGLSAFKYYLLFQHMVAPDESMSSEPSWIVSPRPGPYITEKGRSVYARLGSSIAFMGLDCRTERTHGVVVGPGTYDLMFKRLRKEITESQGEIKHVLLMLGVPIAYPRMVWLERILTSRAMLPVKALARRGYFPGLSNEFDGNIEILDDLDDHWCAQHHKKERNNFVIQLQEFAKASNVRVTILAGDVHLAGIGRFYSKEPVPPVKDHRHILNVISSAIVNTPPPVKLADFLNKRNRVHKLGHDVKEDMVRIFTQDVDDTPRNNQRLLPRRNWCSIIATAGSGETKCAGPVHSPTAVSSEEVGYTDVPGSLSVVLHMEKDQHSTTNETIPYEIIVPPLLL